MTSAKSYTNLNFSDFLQNYKNDLVVVVNLHSYGTHFFE